MPGPAFAVGDDVSLHPIEEEDHEFVQRNRQHPSTRVPLVETTIRTRDEVAELLAETGDYHFLVCRGPADGDDPERVGVVGFAYTRDDDWGSLLYWIAPGHRGEGYVSGALGLFLDFAFAQCGFHKVVARTLVTNEASIQTLESLGFEREGEFREERFVNGEWRDGYQYALLVDDYLD